MEDVSPRFVHSLYVIITYQIKVSTFDIMAVGVGQSERVNGPSSDMLGSNNRD